MHDNVLHSSFAVALPIGLVGGSGIFLAFLIVFFLAVTYGLFTRRGSGISQRPYHNAYSDAPGAFGPSRLSGRDGYGVFWTRSKR
jgi:hypothetical protein